MSKKKILFLTGVWVMVLPFLGFPTIWKKILLVLTGGMLISVSYLWVRTKNMHNTSRGKDIQNKLNTTFTDNRDEIN